MRTPPGRSTWAPAQVSRLGLTRRVARAYWSENTQAAAARQTTTFNNRRHSRNWTLTNELWTSRWPLYSMKPNFPNLFMKRLTRGRVVPMISANVSWLIGVRRDERPRMVLWGTPCGGLADRRAGVLASGFRKKVDSPARRTQGPDHC